MSEKISTIILSAQQRLKELLSLYLSEAEGFELLEDYSDFSDIYNTISSLSKCALIVDLENPSAKYYDFIRKVTEDFSNCRVVAVYENPTVDSIVKIMRAGAKEVLSSPVIKGEFFDVLARIKEQLNDDYRKSNRCRMVTVFSNKGGIGKLQSHQISLLSLLEQQKRMLL